jgi:glycosyltransferase involved in cell wall biosynthesis
MIFILIPLFNEADNVENLCKELSSLPIDETFFLVFSDDGSFDNTKEIVQHHFKNNPHVTLGDGVNRGPGAAFNLGFQWILANSTSPDDLVVTMEADCTSDLSILPEMLVLSKLKYELVLASVYAQGGGFEKTSFIRRIISMAANFGFRFFFDVQVLTLSSFYRVYKISLLRRLQQRYEDEIIKEKGFVSMLEILLKAIRNDATVIEVPMKLHSSKRVGKSKMKVIQTAYRYLAFLSRVKYKGF